MFYKVLYIDDDSQYLKKVLESWKKPSQSNQLQFIGLSLRDNNNKGQAADKNVEIHYIDVDSDLLTLEESELRAELFTQFLEKITDIQPNAILCDLHFGPKLTPAFKGGYLLKEIRRYYPYMPVVMATMKSGNTDVDEKKGNYLLAESSLKFDKKAKPKELCEIVCKQCSNAIDYRGIPMQKYKNNEIDTRLPDISGELVQKMIANNTLFSKKSGKNKNDPIIFLQGSLGSGRHLLALWINALLQRRDGGEFLPSILNEINCSCLKAFPKDTKEEEKKIYIKRLFKPSKGKVLFLTDVDKVPESVQEAFEEITGEWRNHAFIITTATDSKRIGLERLPEGIKQIGFKVEGLEKKKKYLESLSSTKEQEELDEEIKKLDEEIKKLKLDGEYHLKLLLYTKKQKEGKRQKLEREKTKLDKEMRQKLKREKTKLDERTKYYLSFVYTLKQQKEEMRQELEKEIEKLGEKIKKLEREKTKLNERARCSLESLSFTKEKKEGKRQELEKEIKELDEETKYLLTFLLSTKKQKEEMRQEQKEEMRQKLEKEIKKLGEKIKKQGPGTATKKGLWSFRSDEKKAAKKELKRGIEGFNREKRKLDKEKRDLEQKITDLKPKKTEERKIFLLSDKAAEFFTKRLKNKDTKINYKIVNCTNFESEVTSPSSKEKSRVQEELGVCNKKPRILVVKNIMVLEGIHKTKKEDFSQWIKDIKPICVMVKLPDSPGGVKDLLLEIFGEYETVEKDIEKLEIKDGKVYYFSGKFKVGSPDFVKLVKRKHGKKYKVSDFDCRVYSLTEKINCLKDLEDELLKKGKDTLLFLENVDRVSNNYLESLDDMITNLRKEGIQVVASVTNSSSIGMKNLPDEIRQLRFPSLQERFEGCSFMSFNNDANFFNFSGCQRPTAKPECFFQELCQSIVERVNLMFSPSSIKLTRDAEILLALQFHDWPEIIFDESRGIYDLEQLLMNIGKDMNDNSKKEKIIHHKINYHKIELSNYAADASNLILHREIQYIRTDKKFGYELPMRISADKYSKYIEATNKHSNSTQANDDPLDPFEAKSLFTNPPLGPELGAVLISKKIITGMVNDLKLIVASVKKNIKLHKA